MDNALVIIIYTDGDLDSIGGNIKLLKLEGNELDIELEEGEKLHFLNVNSIAISDLDPLDISSVVEEEEA